MTFFLGFQGFGFDSRLLILRDLLILLIRNLLTREALLNGLLFGGRYVLILVKIVKVIIHK